MEKIVLTDTCFWLGLIDPRDQYHSDSKEISRLIENERIIIPWPCLYESIYTHLVNNRKRLLYFETLIKRPNIEFLTDEVYKDAALEEVFNYSRDKGYSFSLTDAVIREILKNTKTRIDYLVTFNVRDFHDLCAQHQIEIIHQ